MPFNQTYVRLKQPAIGCLVREIRQTLKLTQGKFASQLGVTFPTINRWENGHALPSSLALRQIDSLLTQLGNSPDLILRDQSKALQNKYFLQRNVEE